MSEDPQVTVELDRSVFASIPDALDDIRAGKIVLVVDDADRENEGDFVIAAEHCTDAAVNFMVTHGHGIVCLPVIGSRLDSLAIPQMVNNANGDDMAGIQGDCGNYLLVSGAGDSMTRDSVRLAEMGAGTVILQVAALEFPGAVSALWDAADRGSATAVVKDLTSGRYEAYAISLSCR